MTSTAQDMSPDFVLMRLVAAAEDDRAVGEESGTILGPGGPSGGLGVKAGLAHPGSLPSLCSASLQGAGPAAPSACRTSLSVPSLPQSSVEAQGGEFTPSRGGLRPRLLLFPDIMMRGTERGLDAKTRCFSRSDPAFNVHNINNNGSMSPGREWGVHPRRSLSTAASDPAEMWPLLSEKSRRLALINAQWDCPPGSTQGSVFKDLARRLGSLGGGTTVPACSCQGGGSHGTSGSPVEGLDPEDDPTETSDALLVLEGLGAGEGLEGEEVGEEDQEDTCDFLLHRKREMVEKMSGSFSLGSLQAELTRREESDPSRPSTPSVGPPPSAPATPSPRCPARTPGSSASLTSTPRRTPTSRGGGLADTTLKVPGRWRSGSLKGRLSRMFRTKSCGGAGSGHLLDPGPGGGGSTGSLMGGSTGSLVDMVGRAGVGPDTDRSGRCRLTRTHSAFSPASLSTFAGETASLGDISRRGVNMPRPPTPPPPPRRSLSLLDDIVGPQPGSFLDSAMGASLQSLPLPLPPPPPSHASLQHSVSLNDTFLRALPHSSQSQANAPSSHRMAPPSRRMAPPTMLCPLRAEASNFTASLRELEKCGWYWGPMNWEDAEMKLKGRLDGSFLVRDSSDPRYILSLSFRSQGVTHHTRMEHYRGTFSLWCHPKLEDRCHSVVEFIERAIMHSKNGKFLYFLRSRVPGLPPTPVQLLYPVSRFSNVKSLQHLCRFRLRQMVRIDHIQDLPLPKPLISYLRKFYYYDPEEETYLSFKSIVMRAGPKQEEAESQT
ncbi:suppressor of cytokine signaling 7 [Gadus chalcogrammus]|uniref:suppressor of cytokine signaling 7 n=1 Tax=Gadus chalcogrammus TaxID=1042646 RepID=UPI0024C2D495|nr:suppressor of cytokine signaling 7 [Gadus chalcogrammus]